MLGLLAALTLVLPGAALADGCNGSAGDTQYFDPLASCNTQQSSGHEHSGSTTPTTTTPAATTPSTATAASANTTTSSTDPTSTKSLPFTGLDLGPAVLIGVALLGGGVILRRLIARGETG